VDYRLIALDLDGTLLSRRLEISPRTRAALRAARERGILTVIATGRSRHSAMFWSREIGGGPVICCNGAAVFDGEGHLITSKGIAAQPLGRLVVIARETGVLIECYTLDGILLQQPVRQARLYLRWVKHRLPWFKALFSLMHIWRDNRIRRVRDLAKWVQSPGRPDVLKVSLIAAGGALDIAAAQIAREMPGLQVTSSGPASLEVTATGVSKGDGLRRLGALLQIPREAMIAVGDAENDVEMLRYAGLGVAMGNASAGAKAASDRITETCDADGVAVLIDEVCLT